MPQYHITTYGCQMNAHDSERIGGMLEQLGYGAAGEQRDADVVVFNTCTIRERPDQKLFHQLEHMGHAKRRDPNLVVAVGGCLVEAQRDNIFARFPFVDVAFGPGRIHALGDFLTARAGGGVGAGEVPAQEGFYGIADERQFAATLPQRRARSAQAWVQVSMGCNSKCAYCIVPSVRGRETSRPHRDILTEVSALAADGVREITLLGQNVNSYGRDLAIGERATFAELLRMVGSIEGIERVRFTSPHPKDMRDDVIAAIAECDAVCPHVHLPVQSGSTRVLKAMRRTYSRERYLRLVDKLRASIPDLALTTDIIVGFPGETEAEFAETVSLCEQVQYDGAFTFAYSRRSGTEAAELDDIPAAVKQERLAQLVSVVRDVASRRNEARIGSIYPVMVEGNSRRQSADDSPRMLHGRTMHNIKIDFPVRATDIALDEEQMQPGSIIDVRVAGATSEGLRGVPVSV